MVLRGLLCLVLAAGAVLAFRTATAEPDARFTGNLDIDSVRYDQYARAVADSRSLGAIPPLYPPGFIALLAATYAVAGASYLAAKVVLAALLVGAAVLVAYTTWRVVGPAEAVIAAALTVFSPLMLAYVSTLQYEVPAAFLSALVMALLVGASQRPPPLPLPRAAAIGLACAGAALTREPLALWLPLALFVVLPPERRVRGTKRAAVVAVVMAVAFALPIGGWTIVQYRSSGQVVFLSGKSDVNLRVGHNPNANGTYHVQLESIATPNGWAFVREYPRDAMRLAGRKVLYFWGVLRDPWTVTPESAAVVHRLSGGWMPYGWTLGLLRGAGLAALFLVGVVLSRRRPRLYPAVVFVGSVLAVHVMYFGAQRFMVPVYPQVAVLASLPLAVAARGVWARRHLGVALLVVGVWGVFAQQHRFAGRYRLEAESLGGIGSTNRADPAHPGVTARFAPRGAARAAVVLPADPLPRGSYLIQVHARGSACEADGQPAMEIVILGERRTRRLQQTFTTDDLCGGDGYQTVEAIGVLRRDEVIALSVNVLPAGDFWLDAIDVHFGYGRRLDLPRAGRAEE